MDSTKVSRKLAYGLPELSQQTNLSQGFLRAEIRAGRLPVRRVGRRVLVLAEDWERYVETHWGAARSSRTDH